MIEVVPFDNINKEKWDRCILHSTNGNVYGLYDSISQACDHWIGIIYKDYESVLALPLKKKLGLTYSWHPQFMGPLGVFSQKEDAQVENEMYSRTIRNSWWIKMHYWTNHVPADLKQTELVFQKLDLKGVDIQTLRSNYNDNTTRNIRKAIKSDLQITNEHSVDVVINAFKENKGNQIANINDDSYVLLKKLMNHWLKTKYGRISAIYKSNELLAIGYFLSWNGITIYYKGVVTEAGKQTGAMHYLIDREIEKSMEGGKYFDFGGSNSESVARFYRGFGGIDKKYYLLEFKKFKI